MGRSFLLSLALVSLAAAHAQAALVAHFRFDEGSGTTVSSAVGGWTGTFEGSPTWVTTGLANVPGGTSAALAFNGSTDRVMTNYAGIGGSAARSVAAWIKLTAVNNSAIAAWGNSGVNGAKWHVRINEASANGPVGAVRTEIQGTFEVYGAALQLNRWYHVATVYGAGGPFGDSGHVATYVDGQLVSLTGVGASGVTVNTQLQTGANTTSFTKVVIGGRYQAGSAHSFHGLIDDVRIYDHALSAAEVYALAVPEPSGMGLALVALAIAAVARPLRRRYRRG